jgi:hypothetical protein
MARAELDRLAKELLERRGGRAAGMGEPDPDRAKVSVRQLAEDADQACDQELHLVAISMSRHAHVVDPERQCASANAFCRQTLVCN